MESRGLTTPRTSGGIQANRGIAVLLACVSIFMTYAVLQELIAFWPRMLSGDWENIPDFSGSLFLSGCLMLMYALSWYAFYSSSCSVDSRCVRMRSWLGRVVEIDWSTVQRVHDKIPQAEINHHLGRVVVYSESARVTISGIWFLGKTAELWEMMAKNLLPTVTITPQDGVLASLRRKTPR